MCHPLSLKNQTLGPIAQVNPRSPTTESYRTIRTNIQFAGVAKNVKVILTTSTVPGEGKTFTTCNLAVVAAQAGKRVLVIDSDMRKPQLHQNFQVSNLTGLSSLLIKENSFDECVIESKTPGLFLLPSGPIPPNPSEMLGSRAFAQLIDECREEFDLILLDSPPIMSVTDALILARLADGVVIVINSQRTSRATIGKAVKSLQQIEARILGVVLNRVKTQKGESYYYQSYYGVEEAATV